MKHLSLFVLIFVLLLCLVGCADDKTNKVKVQVPQFISDNDQNSRSIRITLDNIAEYQFYMNTPPILSFSEQEMSIGDSIKASFFDNPLDLILSIDSAGNYVFEGSSADEVLKVTVGSDNKSFEFIHVASFVADVGYGDIYDYMVFIGKGSIHDSSISGCYTYYDFINNGADPCFSSKNIFFSDGEKTAYLEYSATDRPSTSGHIPADLIPEDGLKASDYQTYIDEMKNGDDPCEMISDHYWSFVIKPYFVVEPRDSTIKGPNDSNNKEDHFAFLQEYFPSWNVSDELDYWEPLNNY